MGGAKFVQIITFICCEIVVSCLFFRRKISQHKWNCNRGMEKRTVRYLGYGKLVMCRRHAVYIKLSLYWCENRAAVEWCCKIWCECRSLALQQLKWKIQSTDECVLFFFHCFLSITWLLVSIICFNGIFHIKRHSLNALFNNTRMCKWVRAGYRVVMRWWNWGWRKGMTRMFAENFKHQLLDGLVRTKEKWNGKWPVCC